MRAEMKIFNAYLELKESRLYFNQIKEQTKLSNSSLQNALNKLIENNTIQLEKTKSNTFYKIKDKKLFSLKFCEIDINSFNNLNIGVKVPLRNFLKEMPKNIFTIILFGSAAKKEEQDKSDIDLLIATDNKIDLEKQKKEAQTTSKYSFSLFECSTKQFIEGKDPVIIQAKKTGLPVYKEQNFYEVLLDEYR